MTDKLPPNLLQLFQARPALRYLPPSDYAPEDRRTATVDGLAAFLPELEKEPAPYEPSESWLQRKDRERLEKREATEKLITEDFKNLYKPHDDPKATGDPMKTIFVGRLPYTTTEQDLRGMFRQYGPIAKIRVVENEYASTEEKKKKRTQGYAFVEYEHERDMKNAIDDAQNLIIAGRRILVDVERGRTTKDWRPRRYGGGLGGRGYTKEQPVRGGYAGYGGGMGGGFRGGGFRGRGGFGGRGGFSDRGGYGGGGRFGGGGGGRFSNGAPPEGAPSGPRGPRNNYGSAPSGGYSNGGYGGSRDSRDQSNGYSGGRGGDSGGSGSRYDDRSRSGGYGVSGGNREPVGSGGGSYGGRDGGSSGSYRDRDGGSGYERKRPYEGTGGYDESRQRRRY